MGCNDSIELFEQLTLIQEENYIIAQPNIEPTLLHKFRQFHPHPFIEKLFYDNNLGDPASQTDCDAVTMMTF